MSTDFFSYYINNLHLSNYRNHKDFILEIEDKVVVVTGANGAGKTNILEAISLLSPGRGLKNAKLSDILNKETNEPWISVAKIKNRDDIVTIGSTIVEQENRYKRIIKVNGEPIKTQNNLTEYVSVIWLTPQMDQLFLDSASTRRKFLDRLTYNFFPDHASNVALYEHLMRERAKILKENYKEKIWLDSVEQKMAEACVNIAFARNETVNYLNQEIGKIMEPFPKGSLSISGDIENSIKEKKAIIIENELKEKFVKSRQYDYETGKTNVGVHKTDLIVYYTNKQINAEFCSTGEQKALLLSIILAEISAKIKWRNSAPIVLLDEVAAHLDENRRNSLFDNLCNLKVQAWLTGTDKKIFEYLEDKGQFFEIG